MPNDTAKPASAAVTLPDTLKPLREALDALAGLRERLDAADAEAASAASGEAAATRRAEDLLGDGQPADDALAEAERHRRAAVAARAAANGLRRRVAEAEAALPAVAEQGREAVQAFAMDCLGRVDGRYRKALATLLPLLGEACAIKWALGLPEGAHALHRIKLPPCLSDTAAGPWVGVGSLAVGDVPAEPSDAGRQLARAAALVAEAERVGAARERLMIRRWVCEP